MKLSLLQENLQSALTLVLPAVATRSTLPVLSNICLEAKDGQLRLSAMNLEISLSLTIGALVEEPGSVTLPAHLLLNLVKTFPKDRIDLALNSRTQTMSLRCARSAANIKGIDASEFPNIPQFDATLAIPRPAGESPQTFTLPAATLQRLIRQVAFAAATDESRPTLAAVFTTLADGRLTLAATDGFRLAVASAEISDASAAFSANIPAAAYQRLAGLIAASKTDDDDIHIACFSSRNQVMFRLPGCEMVSQLVEGNYPDYRRIVPSSAAVKTTVRLAAAEFSKAVAVANIFIPDANIVNLKIAAGDGDGALSVLSQNAEFGDQETSLDAEITGPELTAAFNGRFLAQGLKAIDAPTITLFFETAIRPVVIRPESADYLYMLMPMNPK